MTKYKVVFLDIDGTILRPDHTIENSTRTAISDLQRKEIEVVLATGRPLHEITELGEELNINSFIAYNGAYAIYQGDELLTETMNGKLVEEFIQIAKENKHDLVFYTRNKNYFTNLDSDLVQKFIDTFDFRKNEIYHPSILEDVLGITIIASEANANVHYNIDPTIHLSQVNIEGVTNCFDIIREQVNKGYAVKVLLNKLNVPSEHAIAIGDGMNDKEMLMNVGEGFAMGNAHPELFQYAKHKTTTVNNSGIYNGLKSLGVLD